MEIRTQSKTGPLVPPLAEIPAKVSQQLDAMRQRWLDQLNRDPASFARLELEIHDQFRRLADQMTASLLAEASVSAHNSCNEFGACLANHCRIFWFVHVHSMGWA
jgi:hypothetical protein